ncbi:MAG TPA: hypothetical protein VHE12_08940 [bacterium]|nr:hypothetical protein [bacterium]
MKNEDQAEWGSKSPSAQPLNETIHEASLKVKSGEYRFIVRESPRSGRYLLIEDVRVKPDKTRVERVVLYPELLEAFEAEFQRAKAVLQKT